MLRRITEFDNNKFDIVEKVYSINVIKVSKTITLLHATAVGIFAMKWDGLAYIDDETLAELESNVRN